MVLAAPGSLHTSPPSSSPLTGGSCLSRRGRGTGGQNGAQADVTQCDMPVTAGRHRDSLLSTLHPTTRQPATAGAVDREGESRRQGEQQQGQPQVADPQPHTHAVYVLRQFTIHISTNDLHCCKPALLLQRAPSGGRPRQRPANTVPLHSDPPHQQ